MTDEASLTGSTATELDSLRRRVAELEAQAAENQWHWQVLAEREAGFRRIIDQAATGYFFLDLQLRIVRVNRAWLQMHKYQSPDEVVGQHISLIVVPEDVPDIQRHAQHLLTGATIPGADVAVRCKDQSIAYVAFSAHPVFQHGRVVGLEGFSIDITERRRAEQQVRRVTRALRALSQCNRALVRAEREGGLLEDICRIIVETAGYRAAWTAYPGTSGGKPVVPAAQCGFQEGLLETLGVTWDESDRGRGVVGTVLRTRKTVVVQDVLTDSRLSPWRDKAVEMDVASCAALPLLAEDQLLGALAIYAPESEAFDAEELELLADLADNLAYGISSLRIRKTHQEAREALAQNKGRLEALLRSLPEIVLVLDEEGRYLEILTSHEQLLPASPNRLKGHNIREVVPSEIAEPGLAAIREALRTRTTQVMEYALEVAGGKRWFEGRTTPVQGLGGGPPTVVWVAHDITERKNAEEALRRSHNELERRVLARTAELAATNERLLAEVAERIRAEEAVQQEQQRLRQLLEVYEQHRKLIAYDIHDTVCQRLTGALMTFEGCTSKLQPQCAEMTRQGFSRVVQLLREGLREARRLMSGLRPPILDESGLVAAIDYLVCEYQGVDGLEIVFYHDVQFYRLAPPLETAIFRIVQEGLTNAQRHSRTKIIRIGLIQRDCQIQVSIEDWGIGFDPARVQGKRFGLEGMRERTQLFGGTLRIESEAGRGTRIYVELPLVSAAFADPDSGP